MTLRDDPVGLISRSAVSPEPGTASQVSERSYVIESVEVLAETPDLRMTVSPPVRRPFALASQLLNISFGMEGQVIETRAPASRFEVGTGQTGVVQLRHAHRVARESGGHENLPSRSGSALTVTTR